MMPRKVQLQVIYQSGNNDQERHTTVPLLLQALLAIASLFPKLLKFTKVPMLLSDGGGAQHRGCSSVARKITAKHRQASEGDNQGGTCAAAY